MSRFQYNEVGCVVDTYNNCKNYETAKEVIDLLNDLAAQLEEVELKAMTYGKISEFAYELISNTLSEKLSDLDTMFAIKQLLTELTKNLEKMAEDLREINNEQKV